MWPFGNRASKEKLQGWKRVKVNGSRYVIRKLNPLLDFPADRMPQIFSSFISRRPFDPEKLTPEARARLQEDLQTVLEAGVIKPSLVSVGKGDKRGKEDGITADDLMRDDTGVKLYIEIITHSLNMFKGLKGVFFSLKTRLSLFIRLRNHTESLLYKPSSPMAGTL